MDFGSDFTVGIEEELFLVDRHTRRLAHEAGELLGRIDLPADAAGYEAYAASLELRSPPCRTGGEAAESAAALGAGASAFPAAVRASRCQSSFACSRRLRYFCHSSSRSARLAAVPPLARP